MLLRSGKVATTNEDRPRRRYTRRMVNPSNNQNPPDNNGEPPSTSASGGSTVATSDAELVPSTANSTPVRSKAHNGSVMSYVGSQGPPVDSLGTQGPPWTPPPKGNQLFRPYVSGFSMLVNDREQPFGMPTAIMKNLHNSTSTYAYPLVNASLPL